MPLGWALMEGGCVQLSGCSYIGQNGYDYSNYFFDNSYACGNECIEDVEIICPDTSVIDLNIVCTAIYEPVCGCDNVTYSNSCVAFNHYGITEFTEGECVTATLPELNGAELVIYPNPASSVLNIKFGTFQNGMARIFDIAGKEVMQQKITGSSLMSIEVSTLPSGSYILEFSNEGSQIHERFMKE
jgi:hypothetical protein